MAAGGLSGLSGKASLNGVPLPEFPKLPEKIRRIDPQGSARFETEVQEFLKKLALTIKRSG